MPFIFIFSPSFGLKWWMIFQSFAIEESSNFQKKKKRLAKIHEEETHCSFNLPFNNPFLGFGYLTDLSLILLSGMAGEWKKILVEKSCYFRTPPLETRLWILFFSYLLQIFFSNQTIKWFLFGFVKHLIFVYSLCRSWDPKKCAEKGQINEQIYRRRKIILCYLRLLHLNGICNYIFGGKINFWIRVLLLK